MEMNRLYTGTKRGLDEVNPAGSIPPNPTLSPARIELTVLADQELIYHDQVCLVLGPTSACG